MQKKVFLFLLAGLSIQGTFVRAQHASRSKIRVSSSAITKVSKDSLGTIAAPKPVAKPELLAENIPAAPVAPVNTVKPAAVPPPTTKQAVVAGEPTENSDDKVKYALVPLAGTKSYFGEKNDYVNDYVRTYLEVHNKTLNNVQNASTQPFSLIDDVLEKKQLPKELKYLAVIESALNHKAVSRAGAVGPWQLMESTAKMMGLSVTRRKDDRTDWTKSTAAATKYLELLYSQLDDWLLVIAAYNSGPTPVQKAIARTGSHNFWDIKEYLPRETQGHVLAFIATASIFENLSKFINLGSIPVDFKFGKEDDLIVNKKDALTGKAVAAPAAPAPFAASTVDMNGAKKPQFTDEELKSMAMVRIMKPIHLELMAQELGIDKKLLARWNSDYDLFVYETYPTPFYNLRLPKAKLNAFINKKDHLTSKSEAIFSQMPR
jgi:membrane-bound lytic murein transglycosylase D